MSDSHISFSQLSDFYDDEILIESEKEFIKEHLCICEECNSEFIRLKKTINMISHLARESYDLGKISAGAIRSAKFHRKRNIVIRFIPAMAAAVLIFTMWGMQTSMDKNSGVTVSGNSDRSSIRRNVNNEKSSAEKVVNVISNYRGKVVEIADQYVEGEITYDKFNRLLRDLGQSGFNKIHYRVVSETDNTNNSLGLNSRYRYLQNIEEVGAGDIMADQSQTNSVAKKHSIRFRVFK